MALIPSSVTRELLDDGDERISAGKAWFVFYRLRPGVVLLCAALAELELSAYSPALVKRSVAGRGQAPKDQISRVVCAMLGFQTVPAADATDALAVAITHANALLARRTSR